MRKLSLLLALTVSLPMFLSVDAVAGELTVPLSEWQKAKAKVKALREASQKASKETQVAVGETRYEGRSDGRNLRVKMNLVAQLGRSERFKRVPVIGTDAVIVSATHKGKPIALSPEGNYFVWYTQAEGQVELQLDFVVPPKGPRGSIEYRFRVVQSPVTELRGFFPSEALSPRVSAAVTSKVEQVRGGTSLVATLKPTSEIHIVGFHDVTDGDGARQAKVYGETLNLVSLAGDSIELFSVVNLTILYAAEKRFRIELPSGYEIVSADGQGAFQYTVETIDHRPVLVGETAFGIRDRYEISLRLKRALSPSDKRVRMPVPRLLDVERDAGFVAIEIPGKLSVEKVEGTQMVPIDVRELPEAIVRNSVSPVVRAFRYAGDSEPVWLNLARYPEIALAAGGVDHLRAVSVVTADGRVMTDVTFTIRNNLQQYLSVDFGKKIEVKSAVLDGDPIKPSRDASGKVLVPLVRSKRGSGGLVPFKVQLVYEGGVKEMGFFGKRALSLPKLDVPVSSLSWKVYVPGGYRTTGLLSDIRTQRFVKDAGWQRTFSRRSFAAEDQLELAAIYGMNNNAVSNEHRAASAERASGAMPVRVRLPRVGTALGHQRYWVDANQQTGLFFYYARTPVALLGRVLSVLLLAVMFFFSLKIKRMKAIVPAVVLAFGLSKVYDVSVVTQGLGIAVLVFAVVTRLAHRLWARVVELFTMNLTSIKERIAQRREAAKEKEKEGEKGSLIPWAGLWLVAKSFILLILGMWVFGRVAALIELLGNPL